jgi:hypothetical protein
LREKRQMQREKQEGDAAGEGGRAVHLTVNMSPSLRLPDRYPRGSMVTSL